MREGEDPRGCGECVVYFGAFICCIYFCFSCASGGNSLPFRGPMEGAIEPLNVSRHGSSVEDGNVIQCGLDGLVLWTLFGISEARKGGFVKGKMDKG